MSLCLFGHTASRLATASRLTTDSRLSTAMSGAPLHAPQNASARSARIVRSARIARHWPGLRPGRRELREDPLPERHDLLAEGFVRHRALHLHVLKPLRTGEVNEHRPKARVLVLVALYTLASVVDALVKITQLLDRSEALDAEAILEKAREHAR